MITEKSALKSVAARHIPYLDGWRGIAILAVLFGHFVKMPNYWWVGRWGVQMFFVLSGYLMCDVLFIKKVKLSDFFAKRAIRILPAFFLFTFIIVIVFYLITPDHYFPNLINLFATITFLRSYIPVDQSIFKEYIPIGHFWSLNVEEHSYMFLACVALIARSMKNKYFIASMLTAATLIAFSFQIHYFNHPFPSGTDGDVRSEAASLAILASVALSYIKNNFSLSFSKNFHQLVPTALLIISFTLFFPIFGGILKLTISPILLALSINFFELSPIFVIRLFSASLFRWFGVCSFSIYLWQQPFYWLSERVVVSGAMMGCFGTALGFIMYYIYEQPARKKLASLWGRRDSRKSSVEIFTDNAQQR